MPFKFPIIIWEIGGALLFLGVMYIAYRYIKEEWERAREL